MEKEERPLTPEQDALEYILACKDKSFLEGRRINAFKGRGLFTNKTIEPSSFVVEYRGKIYSIKTTTSKETCADSLTNYLYEFTWSDTQWCIDASSEDWTLGRLVNDDHINPNCEVRPIVSEGIPHLCLFAVRKISAGQEITFNYGDASYPWRSAESFDASSSSHMGFHALTSTPRSEELEDQDVASENSIDDEDKDEDEDGRHDDGQSLNSESFSDLRIQRDFMDDSLSRDSSYTQNMSEDLMQQPGSAQRTRLRKRVVSSYGGSSSDEEYRPRRASQKSKGASYTTKNFCYYCGEGVRYKMARHLLKHVEEDPNLSKAFSLPPFSKERKNILADIRNKGNYKHNEEVLKNKSGKLKVLRRLTSKGISSELFMHCPYCQGMLKRMEMWRHVRKCPAAEASNTSTGDKTKVLRKISLEGSPFAKNLPADVKEMLLEMNPDRTTFLVQNDFLLMKLAQHLFDKVTGDGRNQQIRSKLREMGRFLFSLRDKSITSIQDAIKPTNFSKVVDAVKKTANFDAKSNTYNCPSVALRLGRSLKEIVAIVTEAEDCSEQMKRDAETFTNMCSKNWSELVSSPALASIREKKPRVRATSFTRDVQHLFRYLEFASAKAVKGLTSEGSKQDYSELCRVTITQVSVLNKCSPEVSKITLKTFQERKGNSQVLSKHLIRIFIKKEADENIPVLLTSDVIKVLKLLVSKRSACGVHTDNPYLFAMPDSSPTSVFQTRPTIKAFSDLCCARNPKNLCRGTLHKHMARLFQILNLKNDDLADLAKLLRHDFQADRSYFQQPKGTVDLAKVAKLILAMENGCLENYKGKSLDEVEVDGKLEPEEEQISDESSGAEDDEDEESDPEESMKEKSPDKKMRLNNEDSSHSRRSRVEDPKEPHSSETSCSSEEEYVPDSDVCSEKSFTPDDRRKIKNKPDPTSSKKRTSMQLRQTRSVNQWDDTDSSLVKIPKARVANVNYCYICGKAQKKLARHLYTHRHSEPEIVEVFALRKKSVNRAKRIEELRNRGNLKHNEEVLRTGQGKLKLVRTVTSKPEPMPVVMNACLFCKHKFIRKEILRHMQKCQHRKHTKSPSCANRVLTIIAFADVKDDPNISSEVTSILNALVEDEVTSAVLNDPLLSLMARYFCLLNEGKAKKAVITSTLRSLGGLLLALKEKLLSSFEEVLKPENFSKVVETLRELTNKKVLLWEKYGQSLKTISVINHIMALKEDSDKQKIEEAEKFMALCTEEWSAAKKLQSTAPTIVFVQDAQLLYRYIETTLASAHESLIKYESVPVYSALIRVTSAQMFILNMKVDVFNVTLKSFQEQSEKEPQEDADVSLLQFEQIFNKKTVKLNVMDDKDNEVVMTLTPALLSALQLLVSKRESCGVHPENLFLFALPGHNSPVFKGRMCFITAVTRCVAKDEANLYSPLYQKFLARCFQILSLTNDELDQLAKALGREIPTDREHYQKPEAANDIAKILELLSAMESGTAERFEGKSFEEIEIAENLMPHVTPVPPKKSKTLVDDESEESIQMNDDVTSEGSSSKRKAPHRSSKQCPQKSQSRKRRKRSESDSEVSEQSERDDKEVNTEQEVQPSEQEVQSSKQEVQPSEQEVQPSEQEVQPSEQEVQPSEQEVQPSEKEVQPSEQEVLPEERPPSCSVNTPQGTPTRVNKDTTNMLFSDDDDDDMNVDFNMDPDTDEDIPRNKDKNRDAATPGPLALLWLWDIKGGKKKDEADAKKKEESANKLNTTEEGMGTDSEDHMEEDDHVEDDDFSDNRSSSPIINEEKKNTVSAPVAGLKEAKIVLEKLNVEKFRTTVRLSQLFPICAGDKQCQKSSASTETPKNKADEKDIQMICSHCNKIMMKGQTAYQKKGFTDVFCSKDCLFQMFPINKPLFKKNCFKCCKAVEKPSDLIVAAVDAEGTMRDFCSISCLIYFKSTKPQKVVDPVCSGCNKICSAKCGLMSKDVCFKFCSDDCLKDFRRENEAVCEKCSLTCFKPFTLNLEEETVTLCSWECLNDFRKNTQTTQQCPMCQTSLPASDMFTHNIMEKMVQLFCSRNCVISFKQQPENACKLRAHMGGNNRGPQPKQATNTENERLSSDKSPAAKTGNAPTVILYGSVRFCSICSKKLQGKDKVCQNCSSSKMAPVIELPSNKCYNCSEVISRPHNIILAPVDHSGTRKQLCSDKCLAAVASKMAKEAPKPRPAPAPLSQCRMCSQSCHSGSRKTVDDFRHAVCSDPCFINYHQAHNLSVVSCDMCSASCLYKRFTLETEKGNKSFCSDKCLGKFKESVKNPQRCPLCQTSHQMSDMVESKNEENMLEFFCSNRCLTLHKAQAFAVSDRSSQLCEKLEIIEVELKPEMDLIKQEPTEEDYKPNLLSLIDTENVKHEPAVAKEELKTEEMPVLYPSQHPTSTEPTLTHMKSQASCSHCREILLDGKTVYQRKNHTEIFCSSPCLLQFYKKQGKTCTFCLQVIRQSKKAIEAPVDDEGTMKDFCSQGCMSSFNYKRMMTTKVPIVPVASHSQCNMCGRYCISKHEIIHEGIIQKICSDPCFIRLCNLNNLVVCLNCHSNCCNPVILRMEDGSKNLCSAACLTQYKQKIQKPKPCALCSTKLLISDMVESKNDDGELELFCSSSCVDRWKTQDVSSADTEDGQGDVQMSSTSECVAGHAAGASEQTEKLLCAQCRRIIKTAPKVIQHKGKMTIVCGVSCSDEFKRVNNISAKCERCQNEKIPREVKRIDGKDYVFCSDGCKVLFLLDLKNQWGKHCPSCAFCLSISKTVMRGHYGGADMEFCSFDCNLKYNLLFNNFARCDECGRKGKLTQSIPLIGEVKYFCDVKCVQHFCIQHCQMLSTASIPPRSISTEEPPTAIISNVISLADMLAKHKRTLRCSAQAGLNKPTTFSVPDIQTKVVGHASVQTDTKELKNKSLLCTPLVHNKGVSCRTQTVHTETQTVSEKEVEPKPNALPVPVPVYVPVPMNMYSQLTPQPFALPLLLPVPVFLPEPLDSLDRAVKSTKKETKLESSEEKINTESEAKKVEQNNREITGEKSKDIFIQKEPSRDCTDPTDADHRPIFNNQEGAVSDTSFGSPADPERPSSVSDISEHQLQLHNPSLLSAVEMLEDHQNSKISAASPSSSSNPERVHQDKERKEAHREDFSETVLRKHHKLQSRCGADAWRRWILQKKTQTETDRYSVPAVALKEEITHCSAVELSEALCGFIKEVKTSDGEPCSPDNLFYMCLSIQQYLLENGRMENIFSDLIFSKFSSELTKMLRAFKPSITASGQVHTHVEEEFLWECTQLGAYSPIVLLNTLVFFCSKYLGFTTVEQHRQLSFTHFVRRTKTNQDGTKSRFLLFNPPRAISQAETDEDGVPAKRCRTNNRVTIMMENVVNPLRCPVKLYEFYLSKCSESSRRKPNLFYLQPDQRCLPSSPVWFSSTPLDHSTMDAMLVRFLTVRQMWGEDGRALEQQMSGENLFLPEEEESD